MIDILVTLLVIGIIVALVIYVADSLLPDPINRVVKVVAIVIACLAVVMLLLRMFGMDTGLDVPRLD